MPTPGPAPTRSAGGLAATGSPVSPTPVPMPCPISLSLFPCSPRFSYCPIAVSLSPCPVPPVWPRPCTLPCGPTQMHFPIFVSLSHLCPCLHVLSCLCSCAPSALSHLCVLVPMPCLAPSPLAALTSPVEPTSLQQEVPRDHTTPLHPLPPLLGAPGPPCPGRHPVCGDSGSRRCPCHALLFPQ